MSRETSRTAIEKGKRKTGEKFEESKNRFEKDVKTKKAVSEAARSASVEGTDEGMKKIKKTMETAGRETDKEFEKDEKKQQKVVSEDALPREKRLAEMAKKTRDDIKKIEKALASAEVAAARKGLKEAASTGQEDVKFTDTKGKEQEKERKKSEAITKKKGNEIKSTPIKFRR